jgi:hypothetical protein
MAYSHDLLIHPDSGEFDWTYIKQQALTRAQRTFGGENVPPSAIRSELLNLQNTAAVMRLRWRAVRELPDDTEYQMANVPVWGAAGDSFQKGA